MSKKISFLVSLALCLMLALPGYAKKPDNKGGGGGKNTLKATFRDCTNGVSPLTDEDLAFLAIFDADGDGILDFDADGDGVLDCPTPNDRIKSDLLGAYVGGVDGQTQINKGKFLLLLDLDASPVRENSLDFTDCVDSECTAPTAMPSGGLLGETLSTRETSLVALHTTKQDDLLRMEEGTFLPVAFAIAFHDDSDQAWSVRFNMTNEQCEESTFGLVTRTDPDTWVFEAAPSDKACLLKINVREGIREFHGLYHMPFQLVVERK